MTIAIAAAVLTGCVKTEGTGWLNLSITEGEVADVIAKSTLSDYAQLPASGNFSLTIKSGKNTVWSGLVSEWNPATGLSSGNYTAEVTYGSIEDEGPSKPYFSGAANFSIAGGQSTNVTIPVSLGNAIVKIECTDAFRNYYKSWSFTITTGAGNVFDDVKEAIFMDAFKFSITGTFTSQSGAVRKMAAKSWFVDPATCYTVKFDVTNTGSVAITVKFNDTVEKVEFTEDLNS